MATPEEIQTCIDALTTSSAKEDFTLLAAQAGTANTGLSFSVATVNDLPDLGTTNIGDGQVVFVESIGVQVMSLGYEWIGLDGRILRRDSDYTEMYLWGVSSCGITLSGSYDNVLCPSRENTFGLAWNKVSVGTSHATAVKTDGTLWSWGSGDRGKLGDGTVADKSSPVQEISSSTNWCQVSAGVFHSSAVKTDGTIWSWGEASCGRLGDGEISDKSSPVQEISSATNWNVVSVGGCHSSAIKTDGTIWSWGNGACGRLGDGTVADKSSPVQEISSSTNWCQVGAGSCHSAAVKSDGSLWSWGSNCCGPLGDGTIIEKCSPVQEISSSTNWCQVSAGSSHSSAIKTDGTVWSWGQGTCGRLGDGTLVDKSSPVQEICSATSWCQVSAGCNNSSAIKTDGTLWSWGGGTCGKLGVGTTLNIISPVQEFSSSTNWCQVSAGASRTVAAIKLILE